MHSTTERKVQATIIDVGLFEYNSINLGYVRSGCGGNMCGISWSCEDSGAWFALT